MTRSFCSTCNKNTGHKRTFGIGTLIGVVVTFGLLLFFLPLYPRRCIICGAMEGELEPERRASRPSADAPNMPDGSDTKICPFCAETIKAAAQKCRYCGSDLPEGEQPKEEEQEHIPPGPPLREMGARQVPWPLRLFRDIQRRPVWYIFLPIKVSAVLVLLGLGIAFFGPNLLSQVDKDKPKTARTQIANYAIAVEMFKLDVGRYPAEDEGLEALRQDPSGVKRWDGPYVKKKIPEDPWDKAYVYRAAGRDFEILSYGADGAEGGSGLDADIRSSE